jgi:putative endonuclease
MHAWRGTAPFSAMTQDTPLFSDVRDWLTGLMERVRGAGKPPAGVSRYRFGRGGERMAERHLLRLGYRIVARNFRAAGAEIDLVAVDNATVVFVEVKRRSGAGAPEESVDQRKQEQIRRAAETFAQRYRAGEHPMRFDVIAITDEGRRHRLVHLKDAF